METALYHKKIKKNTQSTKIVRHVFISDYHPIFIKHAKAANSLCDKVKTMTSGGLNLPTSNFTARAMIANETTLILACERLILVFKVLYFNKHKTWSPFISNCCEQIWGVEGAQVCGRLRATQRPRHAAEYNILDNNLSMPISQVIAKKR